MSRPRARTRVTSPRSRTGAYSMALKPLVPSSRRPATSNRCTSPRNAAASRSRTVAAASASSDANTLRPAPALGGAASSRLADSFRSMTRPSRSSTALAYGTASITSRRWRSASAVAASDSTRERGWVAPRCSDAAQRDGFTRVVVCGMGGSSLAPQVLATSFGAPSLTVLDSTDPAAVLAIERTGIGTTLFVISSKSGTTVETLAFYHYFVARARPGQFVAITDPGSPLETLALERGFRAVFHHPVDVGGRYAALTIVGMLPAALIGADGRTLLERARAVRVDRAKALGARIAAAAQAGRDKLVLRPPGPIARLADWIEQLVAESSGKEGRGVVPVVDDPVSERRPDSEVVAEFSSDPLDLGAEFLTWEYATGELGERLGVDAFDQPDVEDAEVPEMGITFGRLKRAQARGDIRALLARGRRVAHVHLARPEDVTALASL